jgi:hypothetical protein
MKCKEAARIVKYSQTASEGVRNSMLVHVGNCRACHNLLLLDELVIAIIKARCAPNNEIERTAPNPFLVSRIRHRIQEISDQRFGSWEIAVASMRGWLVAFATVAVILIAVSIRWQPSAITSDLDDELNAQNSPEYLISDVPNSATLDFLGEDDPYAHK